MNDKKIILSPQKQQNDTGMICTYLQILGKYILCGKYRKETTWQIVQSYTGCILQPVKNFCLQKHLDAAGLYSRCCH